MVEPSQSAVLVAVEDIAAVVAAASVPVVCTVVPA
jgi:hypothetical protein